MPDRDDMPLMSLPRPSIALVLVSGVGEIFVLVRLNHHKVEHAGIESILHRVTCQLGVVELHPTSPRPEHET